VGPDLQGQASVDFEGPGIPSHLVVGVQLSTASLNLTLVHEVHDLEPQIVRIHEFAFPPPSGPCERWDESAHHCALFNWTSFDEAIHVISDEVGASPLIDVGSTSTTLSPSTSATFFANAPRGMALGGDVYPSAVDYTALFVPLVERAIRDDTTTPIYFEVINEPAVSSLGLASQYLDIYEAARNATALALSNTTKILGTDVLLGINDIDHPIDDGSPASRTLFDQVLAEHIKVDFVSVHSYPGTRAANSTAFLRASLDGFRGKSPVESFNDMQAEWIEANGRPLSFLNTESNLNASIGAVGDPRQQTLLSAAAQSVLMQTYAKAGFQGQILYQATNDVSSGKESFGTAIFDPRTREPFAPYWAGYLWNRNVPVGSALYEPENTPPGFSIVGIWDGQTCKVMVVNEADASAQLTVHLRNLPPACQNSRFLAIDALDSAGYVEKIGPSLPTTQLAQSQVDEQFAAFDPASGIELNLSGYFVAFVAFT
jgi:hypothetical protein